tara:strand:- start:2068 stop:3207 length:1140 start_codon:yes stop_codon:yes gene_type:complete
LIFDKKALIKFRQDLHKFPELGFMEKRTKSKISETLHKLNIEVHEGLGVLGILKSGKSKKMIALRADIDALPITETTNCSYSSTNSGVMHACGHDGHTAMLIGAADLLASKQSFDGTVIFIFQPNEENGLGAKAMLNEGILSNLPIEEIYAIHNLPGEPLGQLSTREGLICSSESLFEIEIKGKSCHSSMPQVGKDAILIASELIQNLQKIISRKISSNSGIVISVTEFISNGTRNVLAGKVILKGDARARSKEDRISIEKFIRQISNGAALANDVLISVRFQTEFIETFNAKKPTKAIIKLAKMVGLRVIPNRDPMSFSEDFAHLSNHFPGCFFLIGNGEKEPFSKPLHSSDYDFNDGLLEIGRKFWVSLVEDRLPKK